MSDTITNYLSDSIELFSTMKSDQELISSITKAASLITKAINSGNKIFIAGNGGSAADAQHIAAEFVGRFEVERDPLPAIALTTDTSAITAISNDYGYNQVFSRQLLGLAKPGDVFIGISTSGNSPNIIEAFDKCKDREVKTIALTSTKDSKMKLITDCRIAVPASRTAKIQEGHITIGHLLCVLSAP